MGKLISPMLIGFLLGLSGGGFFSVYQVSSQHGTAVADAKKNGLKPDTTAQHDSTGADSASHGTEAAAAPASHDSAGGEHAAAPVKPAADMTHAAETHAAATPVAPASTPPTTPASTSTSATAKPSTATPADGPTPAEAAAHQRRLAKIFSTMGAKDAARVLSQMTDHDVSVILNLLGDRQAAAILTNLPAPRAATLSQMQPRRGGDDE